MTNDPFQVLGITSSASEDEIKAAYRKLAKKYHPDLHPGSATAEAKMKEINEAYTEAIRIRKGGPSAGWQQPGGNASGYGTGFEGFDPFSAFGFGSFNSAYQQSGQSYRQTEETYSDPLMQAALDYLMTGRFYETLQTLNRVTERSAAWYALSARANLGLNNRITALQHARMAVQMEPGNPEYQQLLNQLQYTGQTYQQTGVRFGYPQAVCANPFISCPVFLLLSNCLCRWFICC